MGVFVTTRPDAVVLYFGHNNVWDIRLAENNREKIGNFQEIFNKVKAIPDTLKLLTDKDAEFQNLRAVGAFLVSASLKNGKVIEIKVISEVRGKLKMILPWAKGSVVSISGGKKIVTSPIVEIIT